MLLVSLEKLTLANWKINRWKIFIMLGWPIFIHFQERTVSFREKSSSSTLTSYLFATERIVFQASFFKGFSC